jgi:hypothetical protein
MGECSIEKIIQKIEALGYFREPEGWVKEDPRFIADLISYEMRSKGLNYGKLELRKSDIRWNNSTTTQIAPFPEGWEFIKNNDGSSQETLCSVDLSEESHREAEVKEFEKELWGDSF